LWEAASSPLPKTQKREFNDIAIYTLWNLWKERNQRISKNSSLNPIQVALRIKEDVLRVIISHQGEVSVRLPTFPLHIRQTHPITY
jgi:hypothetical protein